MTELLILAASSAVTGLVLSFGQITRFVKRPILDALDRVLKAPERLIIQYDLGDIRVDHRAIFPAHVKPSHSGAVLVQLARFRHAACADRVKPTIVDLDPFGHNDGRFTHRIVIRLEVVRRRE